MVQNDKKFCLLHSISEEPYIIWLIYVCKMIISSGVFSIILKILIFWVHRGVKEQKTVQNDKKLCLLRPISQEPYIILSFLVQMCKMIVSPGVFFNFKISIFHIVKGLKGQKMARNIKIFCCTFYFRNHIWSSFMVHIYV